MYKNIEKVLAYITRDKLGVKQILVFEHKNLPEAGIQVPAGTVNQNEDIEAAVFREIHEETGLSLNCNVTLIGRFKWLRADRGELHFRNIFHLEMIQPLTNEWLHTVSGKGEDTNLVFRFYWLPVAQAEFALAAEQGKYLPYLMNQPKP